MEQSTKLLSGYSLGNYALQNRMVMAPMTRSRAVSENCANETMALYYGQRAGAGLIITEGVSPSPNGLGYARIPAMYTAAHRDSWKAVANAVHAKGGRIFMQLMHTGRVSAQENLPAGGVVLAPSAVQLPGEMYTDAVGMVAHSVPKEMTVQEVEQTIAEYVQAAQLAVEAGLDGVELHAANGYLIEQFLNPHSNLRTDEFGGSVENRARFLLEIARRTVAAIGADKVGVRFSPYGAFNDMKPYDPAEVEATYAYLAEELNKLGVVYLHVLDHSSQGAPAVPAATKKSIRSRYKGTLIWCGGLDASSAEQLLQDGEVDLAAFGRPFISNPDLAVRFAQQAPLQEVDFSTLYTPGEKGYTDYPLL